MVCWIATSSTARLRLSRENAGKMVSMENGPNIANPASSSAMRRVEGVVGVMQGSETWCIGGTHAGTALGAASG
ncbi:hypothetical protein K9U02_14340 [Xanthomonas arboricola pv. pruni]|uniref:hypothetical protein n=1 Tax=Xanthomonas arboricola TaxID=56448 RepID=UPI001F3D2C94|nr:hypothetical protein [Xanthomonas arboricola]UJO07175.1 hypothetical protein K9U02_14340 [Xanthomonas arboricola pv. pruni]